ncbi:transmembrane protein 17-like [Diabrotica virgifera virgifera]|uniref:Transmembrane protein 17-like isoform X1 n=2 Tax=Diabrotica virgifera virgifera TaxID=50390 RepID=A0A6P7FXN5_DIAVI|nr:transmembrane protein 17-like [Diabrotica virgifera virgifera]
MCLIKPRTRSIPSDISNEVNLQSKHNRKMRSNLTLQMSLYFNLIFLPIWSIVIILFMNKNYYSYDELYRYISVTVVSTIFGVELLRIYLGYEGNLKDKIPELAGFWMLSILLQLPLQGFLLFNPYFRMYVLEIIVQAVMFILLCIQLISGYCAIKFTASEQTAVYKLKKQRQQEKAIINKTGDCLNQDKGEGNVENNQ